jgi:hypothetical protein
MHALPDWHVIHPAVFGYGFAECDEAGVEIAGLDSVWLLVAQKGQFSRPWCCQIPSR